MIYFSLIPLAGFKSRYLGCFYNDPYLKDTNIILPSPVRTVDECLDRCFYGGKRYASTVLTWRLFKKYKTRMHSSKMGEMSAYLEGVSAYLLGDLSDPTGHTPPPLGRHPLGRQTPHTIPCLYHTPSMPHPPFIPYPSIPHSHPPLYHTSPVNKQMPVKTLPSPCSRYKGALPVRTPYGSKFLNFIQFLENLGTFWKSLAPLLWKPWIRSWTQ